MPYARNNTPQEYMEQFTNHRKMRKHIGTTIGPDRRIVIELAGQDKATSDHKKANTKPYMAVDFLQSIRK
jgi:hypothetical protein